MKNKLLLFIILLFISPFIGAIYGMIHDQITYSISEEYYTKFKFIQFGLNQWGFSTANVGDANNLDVQLASPRLGAALVGALATWWVGLIIGVVLGAVGLLHYTAVAMFKVTLEAIIMTIIIALVMGVVGLFYGMLFLGETPANWNIPPHVVDRSSFVAVGAMHNFSYLGGFIGLLAGVVYSFRARSRLHRPQTRD